MLLFIKRYKDLSLVEIFYFLFLFPTDSNSKPKVECSVVTEFTDHICVTMDAELIMFLHDLVSAYLKEKEKGLWLCSRYMFSQSARKQTVFNHFNCPHTPGQIHESSTGKIILFKSGNSLQSSQQGIVLHFLKMTHQTIQKNNRMDHICLPLYLQSCLHADGHILESSMKTQAAECYFHTQWGGQGAQCRQHFNGFPIVTKEQITSLYAYNLAFFMSIKKSATTLFSLFCSGVEREKRWEGEDFHQCLINPD